VSPESAGGSEFTQFVAHHILTYVNRDELVAIVHGQCVTDELGGDRGTPGPRFDNPAVAAAVEHFDLLGQVQIDERTFFD
jgi:hypothetical protein